MQEINFDSDDLSLREVPFKVLGKTYLLREASGELGRKFKNAKLERLVLGDAGRPKTVKGMADLEPMLVAGCTYTVGTDGTVNPKCLTVEELNKLAWPNRVIQKLFDQAKKISEIDQPDTVEDIDAQIVELQKQRDELVKAGGDLSKNVPEVTQDGSES